MSLFNEKLNNIQLKDLLLLIIFILVIKLFMDYLNLIQIDLSWIYFVIIFYFFIRFRGCFSSFKEYFLKIFTFESLKLVVGIVILNIFVSYGLLYLSDFILQFIPSLSPLILFNTFNSVFAFGSFITTVILSPIAEELIFRGVLLNKLKLIVPMSFSILISSILFASLHSFGGIIAAFIFAVCMSILYLKTDNILVPIFAHFLNNFIAECIVIIDKSNVLFTDVNVMMVMSILAIISAILIFIVVKNQWNVLNINKL